jgi:RNAse (barnase) inhibitor barstar
MGEKPTFRIDGAAFNDLEGFYDEIETQLLDGGAWGRDLDALDDVLRGSIGPLPARFRIVWEHTDLSHRRLGAEREGLFDEIVRRISAHPNVELILS